MLDDDNGLSNYCDLQNGKIAFIKAAILLMSFPAGTLVVDNRGDMNFKGSKLLDSRPHVAMR
jgi:hypothetical protein